MTRQRSVVGVAAALYAISAALMAALTFGAANVLPLVQPSPAATLAEPDYSSEEVAAGFRVVTDPSQPPSPLGPPPGDQLIQLVSFNKDSPPPMFAAAPWWLSAGFPRVDHITQFDGGPLQGLNAVPAAGAMLARLAFGIVTTGSQLRALESDQEGGTSLAGLVEALSDRWDVQFSAGYLSSPDLRELLSSGAGAVVALDYGALPQAKRQQAGFDGDHAMYVDGLRLHADGSADYYLMDPMGLTWGGQKGGDWWPAEIIDRAAADFGGGRIVAVWAFAAGLNPVALPSGAGPIDESIGDVPPMVPDDIDRLLLGEAKRGGLMIDPILSICLEPPTPEYCPAGVPAVYQPQEGDLDFVRRPAGGRLPIDLVYTDVPQPGVWRTIVDAPAGVEPTFSYWPSNGFAPAGPVLQGDLEPVTLGGKQVWMVSVPIPEAGTYGFVAFGSSARGGVVTATDVGAISFGN
jgi:hypothetical protein